MIPAPTDRAAHAGLVTRIALAVAAVVGAFLIVFPLATGLPGKSAASGDMMTAMRPQMSDAALAQGRADQKTVATMALQLNNNMLPALAQQLHMSTAQLAAYFGQNLPALAKGMNELPQLQSAFAGLQAGMEQQQANFRQADQIPSSFLPPTTMTVLFVVPGAILLLIAGVGFYRPGRGRQMLAGVSIVGVLIAAGLLACSMYGKATAADQMTAAFRPVFAAQSVTQLRSLAGDATAMSTDLTQKALPALATALNVTPNQLGASVAATYPAVFQGMQQLPAIVGRMDTATSLIALQANNYTQSAAIPWAPGSMTGMFWAMMAPALFLALVGVAGLVAITSSAAPAVRRRLTLRPGAQHH